MAQSFILANDNYQLFTESSKVSRKNVQKLMQIIFELTNRSGLIVYEGEEEIKLIFHATTFIERFKIIFGSPIPDEHFVSVISEIFFLNWENNLIVNNSQIKPNKEKIIKNLAKLFVSDLFIEKLENAQKQSWPALYIVFGKNKENQKLEVKVELLKDQITFNLEDLKTSLVDMKEGGELCSINLNDSPSDSVNNKYQFKCNKMTNLSENQMQELWIKRIKTLIGNVSCSNSIYRELFNLTMEDIEKEWTKHKILFKLNKLIEIIYPDIPYKVLLSTHLNLWNGGHGKNYTLILSMELFDQKTGAKLSDTDLHFSWINKALVENGVFWWHRDSKRYFTKIAIERLSKINKAFFYKIPNSKVVNLLNFVIGVLKNVSFQFEIEDLTENLNEDLKTAECYFKVTYKDTHFTYRVFDVKFSDNETLINQFDVDGKTITTLKEHSSSEPSHLFSKEKATELWKKITKILRKDFKEVWSKWDRLHEVIQTIKHLMSLNGSQNFYEAIQLITIHSNRTTLTKTFEQKMVNDKLIRGFNFLIIFNSYNFKFEINNFDFQTIKAKHSNRILFFSFWDKVTNIILGEKSYYKLSDIKGGEDQQYVLDDLANHLHYLLFQVDYASWKLIQHDEIKYKDIMPFGADFISTKKSLYSKIRLNVEKEQWELTGIDNKTEKIKK